MGEEEEEERDEKSGRQAREGERKWLLTGAGSNLLALGFVYSEQCEQCVYMCEQMYQQRGEVVLSSIN